MYECAFRFDACFLRFRYIPSSKQKKSLVSISLPFCTFTRPSRSANRRSRGVVVQSGRQASSSSSTMTAPTPPPPYWEEESYTTMADFNQYEGESQCLCESMLSYDTVQHCSIFLGIDESE